MGLTVAAIHDLIASCQDAGVKKIQISGDEVTVEFYPSKEHLDALTPSVESIQGLGVPHRTGYDADTYSDPALYGPGGDPVAELRRFQEERQAARAAAEDSIDGTG